MLINIDSTKIKESTMSIQAQFNQDAINALPLIKSAIEASESFEANQMSCSAIQKCNNSTQPITQMNDDELMVFQKELLNYFDRMNWFSIADSMEIINTGISDFCDEQTTVEVEAKSFHGESETFHVQTVDGFYRRDLGCLVMTNSSAGDIDFNDYPTFDARKILRTAEKYIKSIIKEEHTGFTIGNETVYLLIKNESVDVVTRNSNFINADTSNYQREFSDAIKTFSSREDAIQYLKDFAQ